MNLDLEFSIKVLEDTNFVGALEDGVSEEMLLGEGREIWQFIKDFYGKHESIPSKETIAEELKLNSGFLDLAPKEPFSYYFEKLQERYKSNKVGKSLREALDAYEKDDLEKTQEVIASSLMELSEDRWLSRLYSYANEADNRLKKYKERERMGIALPWQTLTEKSGGIRKGQLWVMIARAKIGKTWSSLLFAKKALEEGRRVLYVSKEMTEFEIAERMDAFVCDIPYSDLISRKLHPDVWKKLTKKLESLSGQAYAENFIIVPRKSANTPSELAALVHSHKPDLVVVDAIYKMKPDWKVDGRVYDRVSAVLQGLEDVIAHTDIPIFATTQFNRKVRKGKDSAESGDVAFAYEFAMNASVLLGLFRPPNAVQENIAYLRTLDARAWEGVDLKIKWDINGGLFDELEILKPGTTETFQSLVSQEEDEFEEQLFEME